MFVPCRPGQVGSRGEMEALFLEGPWLDSPDGLIFGPFCLDAVLEIS